MSMSSDKTERALATYQQARWNLEYATRSQKAATKIGLFWTLVGTVFGTALLPAFGLMMLVIGVGAVSIDYLRFNRRWRLEAIKDQEEAVRQLAAAICEEDSEVLAEFARLERIEKSSG